MGAFLAHTVSAYYNAEEQLFMPPHRTLSFNPQITIDDSLLVSQYMSAGKIPFDVAEKRMNKALTLLRNKLSQDGVVHLGELGTLSMNVKGEISFEQSSNGIDDPENFGLEPLPISLLRHKEETIFIPVKRHEIGKYIAMAVAVVLMFLFVTPVSDNAFHKGMQASFSGFASSEQISMMQQLSTKAPEQMTGNTDIKISPVEYTVTESNNSEELANSQVAEITATTKENKEVITEAVATNESITGKSEYTPIHYIIVASSPNEDNAQLAITELSAKMTADYTVVKCGKRHRIAINRYPTANEAQKALAQYQQTFPDAWILSH